MPRVDHPGLQEENMGRPGTLQGQIEQHCYGKEIYGIGQREAGGECFMSCVQMYI